MNTNTPKIIVKALGLIKENGPTILTTLAIVSSWATIPLAARGGIKAEKEMEKVGIDKDNLKEELKNAPVKVVGAVAKAYAPAVGMAALATGCAIGANVINLKRTAALLSLYTLASDKIKEYEKALPEALTEKQHGLVRSKMAENTLEKASHGKDIDFYDTGRGHTRCYDSLSGRAFYHDVEKIKEAVNNFNELLINDYSASLNDFYDYLSLDSIELGSMVGWDSQNLLRITYDSTIFQGEPVLVINYESMPRFDYSSCL